MKEIRKTSQFKKDYKRFKNDKEFVETLMGIVKLLAEGNQIPEEYNPHSLKGNWKNYMECHIENDTLLIWFDKNNNAIELVRLEAIVSGVSAIITKVATKRKMEKPPHKSISILSKAQK